MKETIETLKLLGYLSEKETTESIIEKVEEYKHNQIDLVREKSKYFKTTP